MNSINKKTERHLEHLANTFNAAFGSSYTPRQITSLAIGIWRGSYLG